MSTVFLNVYDSAVNDDKKENYNENSGNNLEENLRRDEKGHILIKVNGIEAYKDLRDRELALHRLMIEVFTMHNCINNSENCEKNSAFVNSDPRNKNVTNDDSKDEGKKYTCNCNSLNFTKQQQRILEDIREMCFINEEVMGVEVEAAKTNPVIQLVAASNIAKNRTLFFDGIDDIKLDLNKYALLGNISNMNDIKGSNIDDGVKLFVAPSTNKSQIEAITSTVTGITSSDIMRVYLNEIKIIEGQLIGLVKEILNINTPAQRRTAIQAILLEKKKILANLRNKISEL